jgi:hypothetical protein
MRQRPFDVAVRASASLPQGGELSAQHKPFAMHTALPDRVSFRIGAVGGESARPQKADVASGPGNGASGHKRSFTAPQPRVRPGDCFQDRRRWCTTQVGRGGPRTAGLQIGSKLAPRTKTLVSSTKRRTAVLTHSCLATFGFGTNFRGRGAKAAAE